MILAILTAQACDLLTFCAVISLGVPGREIGERIGVNAPELGRPVVVVLSLHRDEHCVPPSARAMSSLIVALRRWGRMSGVPHLCQACGKPMSAGQNGAGRWAVCCPDMWVSLGDGYLEHNYPGHSVRELSGPPLWGNCGHDHEVRFLLRGYPV